MSDNAMDLFVQALPTAMGQALSEKGSTSWTVTLDEKSKPFPAATQVLTMLMVAEPSQAEAAVQISAENAQLLSGTSEEAAASEDLQPGYVKTVRAVLTQACEKAAEALPGTKVHVRVAKEIAWTPAGQFSLTATDGGSKSVPIQLLFAAGWPQGASSAASASSQTARGIDVSLLENIEIEVSLQFGGRRLPLRDIGELRSGSVIELDKRLQDPAELVLGDRVVARGEVVIVDGNYGLRITEVV
jgi:flagellar motor switch protein FliN/FliY